MKKLLVVLLLVCGTVCGADLDRTHVYNDFSAGVVDSGTAELVPYNGLWDAENITLDRRGSFKERLGTAHCGNELLGRQPAAEGHVGSGQAFEALALHADANDHERLAHTARGCDGEINALIRHER